MEVREARNAAEVDDALGLRRRVFSGEQGVPEEADRDGRDGEALHVVALDGDRVIGTCRLVFDGAVAKLGRLAVEQERRRHGVGAAIVREAERAARGAEANRIALHAQLAAKDLYAGEGYKERGSPFVDQGIPHVAMEKRLA